MTATEPMVPLVVVIDDDPESQRTVFRHTPSELVRFEVLSPDEVDEDVLNTADLIMVDYLINDWPARDNIAQLGLKPSNGIALTAVLREHAGKLDRPTGFALNTGNPDALWITPAETRTHLIARNYNLEWVFLKSESAQNVQQAISLASAIRRLPGRWPGADHTKATGLVLNLLGLMNDSDQDSVPPWSLTALNDIESCRPPLTELAERNHGLLFLRWLLQRILPYPCFLYDSHRLAARLRVSHLSLKAALDGELGVWLRPYNFKGVLGDFAGVRWWRSGVEYALWELTGGVSVPARALHEKLSKEANAELVPAPVADPIICIDENYRVLDEAFSPSQVVRIQPDDWPSYASQAWTTLELAKQHPRLEAMVLDEEQDQLSRLGDESPASEAPR